MPTPGQLPELNKISGADVSAPETLAQIDGPSSARIKSGLDFPKLNNDGIEAIKEKIFELRWSEQVVVRFMTLRELAASYKNGGFTGEANLTRKGGFGQFCGLDSSELSQIMEYYTDWPGATGAGKQYDGFVKAYQVLLQENNKDEALHKLRNFILGYVEYVKVPFL